MKINFILRKICIFRFFSLHDECLLKVPFPAENRRQGMVLVLAFEELKTVTAARAGLLLDLKALLVEFFVDHHLLIIYSTTQIHMRTAEGNLITHQLFLCMREVRKIILVLQALFLLCCRVVAHEVLLSAEQVGRLHGSASFGAQDAFDHDASA